MASREGSRPSLLVLTSTLILGGPSAESAQHAAGGSAAGASADTAARVAVLRTRTTSHASPAAASSVGSKRRHSDRDGDSGGMMASVVTERSFHAEAGDVLLTAPHTPRSLSGGRVSITLWWRLSAAAFDRRSSDADASDTVASAPSVTATSTAPTSSSASSAAATHISAAPVATSDAAGATVYDGVLSPSVRSALCAPQRHSHGACILLCACIQCINGSAHRVCWRRCAMPPVRFGIYDRSAPPSNAHEALIESLLVSLGDASRYVEYWGRAVWGAGAYSV